ncbi:MAG: hypothetical protein IKY98_05390 [Alphaproteobacteria bacterium]|nr:hypothetical protein [Alphaproteobacteria bacterium]
MANKYLEQQIKYQKEIEKLQERIVYFTAFGSIIGCVFGSVFGYMAGKEEVQTKKGTVVQKISSQDVSVPVSQYENSR